MRCLRRCPLQWSYGERRRPARRLWFLQESLWYGQTGCAQRSVPCLPQGEVQKNIVLTGCPDVRGRRQSKAASGNESCRELRRRPAGVMMANVLPWRYRPSGQTFRAGHRPWCRVLPFCFSLLCSFCGSRFPAGGR